MKLPDERPLSEPQRMLRAVLDSPAEAAEGRRSPVVVAVAAGVVGVLLGGGVVFGVMREGAVGPGGGVATPAPVKTTVARERAGGSPLAPGATARFEHFDVTLSDFGQQGDDFTYRVKLCVRKIPTVPGAEGGQVRLNLESWTARTTGWRTPVAQTVRVGPTSFPVDTALAVGQCGEGVVAARVVDHTTRVLELEYENSLNEKAVWAVA